MAIHTTKIRMVLGEPLAQEVPAGIAMGKMYESDWGKQKVGRQPLYFGGPRKQNQMLRVSVRLAEVRWKPGHEDEWFYAWVQLQAGDMPQATFHIQSTREGAQGAEMLLAPRQGGGVILTGSPGLTGRLAIDVTLTIEPRPMTRKEVEEEAIRARAAVSLNKALDVAAANELHSVVWRAVCYARPSSKYEDAPYVIWKNRDSILTPSQLELVTKAGGWWFWCQTGFGWFAPLDEWTEAFEKWQAKQPPLLLPADV